MMPLEFDIPGKVAFARRELAMPQDDERPSVVFRIRIGRREFTCSGRLVWEGGIVYAEPDANDSGAFLPERVRLEESDLELKHDDEQDRDWYLYHGFVVVA